MAASVFEVRDGQLHLAIPKGDGATFMIQAEADTIPPFNDWSGWDWVLRCVSDAGVTLFEIDDALLTASGVILDGSTATDLSLMCTLLPAAYSALSIGPNYLWGLQGTKGTYVETIVDDGIFYLTKGPFS